MGDLGDGIVELDRADLDREGWQALLAEHGSPIIEPAGPGRCRVTFAVFEEPDALLVMESSISRAIPGVWRLTHLPESGVHALSLVLPSDLRFSYAIHREGSGDIIPDRASPPGLSDPRLQESVAVLPDACPLPLLEEAAGMTPHVEELRFHSSALGEGRRVWISPPVDPCEAMSTVIVFDGEAQHSAPAVRDVLEQQGAIDPTVVVLVDQAGQRARDLAGSRVFARHLTEELMPLLRGHLDLATEPDRTILSGSSFGGLCAGMTALRHPEVFGGAILQSPSCWHHPDLGGDGLLTAPTPSLIEAFLEEPRAPIRIVQEVGTLEFGPPPAQVWQILGNRWLRDVLVAQGYDFRYREFAGGHDAAWWRGTWGEALSWMLPSCAPGGKASPSAGGSS